MAHRQFGVQAVADDETSSGGAPIRSSAYSSAVGDGLPSTRSGFRSAAAASARDGSGSRHELVVADGIGAVRIGRQERRLVVEAIEGGLEG